MCICRVLHTERREVRSRGKYAKNRGPAGLHQCGADYDARANARNAFPSFSFEHCTRLHQLKTLICYAIRVSRHLRICWTAVERRSIGEVGETVTVSLAATALPNSETGCSAWDNSPREDFLVTLSTAQPRLQNWRHAAMTRIKENMHIYIYHTYSCTIYKI